MSAEVRVHNEGPRFRVYSQTVIKHNPVVQPSREWGNDTLWDRSPSGLCGKSAPTVLRHFPTSTGCFCSDSAVGLLWCSSKAPPRCPFESSLWWAQLLWNGRGAERGCVVFRAKAPLTPLISLFSFCLFKTSPGAVCGEAP